MFSPIASYPIGAFDEGDTGFAGAAGSFDAAGITAGLVRVDGNGSQTFVLSGTATGQETTVARGSLIGLGPIGSGAIAELLSISTPITTTISGTATGSMAVAGASMGMALITARAPDIVLEPWRITAGDGSAIITAFPLPPTTPSWAIAVGNPGFTIISYPAYTGSVTGVPFFDLIGSAAIGNPIVVTSTGDLGLTGAVVGAAIVTATAASVLEATAAGSGVVESFGVGSGPLFFNGISTGRYGEIPVSGIGADTIEMVGSGLISVGHNVAAQTTFDFLGGASVSIMIDGHGIGLFDFLGVSVLAKLSGQRVAFAGQSKNKARVLSQRESAKLLGR